MTKTLPHGWFAIPGVQTGEREIGERLNPLRILIPYAKGATILDLGCAEGVIGKWLLDHGGAKLDGVDKHEPYLEVARTIVPAKEYDARFIQCDFDHLRRALPKLGLLPQYDIVLALNIAQKLKAPRRFLAIASRMAKNIFVYSGPHRVLNDPRSGNRPLNIERFLRNDFKLIGTQDGIRDPVKGHLGVRLIFQRLDVIEAKKRADILARRARKAKLARKRRK